MSEKAVRAGLIFLAVLIPLIFSRGGYISYEVIKTAAAGLVVLFLTLAWLARMNNEDKITLLKSPLNLPVIIFYIIAALSLFRTTNLYEGLKAFGELSIWVFAFLLASNHIKEKNTISIIFDLVIAAAFLSAIYNFWINGGIDFSTDRRFHVGTFGHPNFAAQYLVIAIPLAIARFFMDSNLFKRFFYLIALAAMALFLLLTKTRGAWVALAVSLPLMFILLAGKRPDKKKIISIIILAALIFLMVIASPHLIQRALSTFDFGDYSVNTRLHIWKDILRMIFTRPVLGWGMGNFEIIHPAFRTAAEREVTEEGIIYGRAHNEFLHVWVEMGIFGLLAFVWILLTAFKIARWVIIDSKDNEIGLVGLAILTVLAGTIVHACFSSNFQIPATALTVWMLMGMLAAQYNET